jgi:ABC-type sulfate transport system permease component
MVGCLLFVLTLILLLGVTAAGSLLEWSWLTPCPVDGCLESFEESTVTATFATLVSVVLTLRSGTAVR